MHNFCFNRLYSFIIYPIKAAQILESYIGVSKISTLKEIKHFHLNIEKY